MSTYNNDIRFQQAYDEMAALVYGIPVGESIRVTAAQDDFLCNAAVEYLQDPWS